MAHDPRSVANFVLDVASDLGLPVSNLALNKIAYFLHGNYLAKFNEPLIDAKIEAWEFGPVFREVYHEFKGFKADTITARAKRINLDTGEKEIFPWRFSPDETALLRDLAETYLRIKPGKLVDISHVRDGPWHQAWFHDDTVNPGMEISDLAIRSFFAKQQRH